MHANPFLGVFFHWLGGLASGSFYVPYRAVRNWAWETYWMAGGFVAWIIAPWVVGTIMTRDLPAVLSEVSFSTLFWTYFFGALWGLGGLTFWLTVRYLGMSLGMATSLGCCAAFGTLIPPIVRGEFMGQVVQTTSGQIVLLGVAVCLAGITVAGMAGMSKERERHEEQGTEPIVEFDFRKGIIVAAVSGTLSASFAYALAAGDPIKAATLQHGTGTLWQGLPVLVVVLLGGFTSNLIWCLILMVRNGTSYQYFYPELVAPSPSRADEPILETPTDAPAEEMAEQAGVASPEPGSRQIPLLWNYFFCALAGTTWYLQFFFYTMGESQMGTFRFSSWSLHMASIVVFSTLWGIFLHEWKAASHRTKRLIALALVMLVGSTLIIGGGNYLHLQPARGGAALTARAALR